MTETNENIESTASDAPTEATSAPAAKEPSSAAPKKTPSAAKKTSVNTLPAGQPLVVGYWSS